MLTADIFSSGKGMERTATFVGNVAFEENDQVEWNVISIEPAVERQEILGFGGAMTESAAYVYSLLDEETKRTFIQAYFDPNEGLGYNFCRLHIHSCDFSLEPYTYVEENDVQMRTFSVERDERYILPLVRAAVTTVGERLTLFSSPWSPPAWMKDTGRIERGGRLLPEYYAAWAAYVGNYLLAYRKKGIRISAVTVQNESHAVQTWESCQYTAEEEAEMAVRYLKPEFRARGLDDVPILVWHHNKERVFSRAVQIFSNSKARETIWGIGFHWYSGTHFPQLSMTAEMFPEKKLIATEFCLKKEPEQNVTSAMGFRYAQEISGDLNHGACACVDWNILLDEKGGPYHWRERGGCAAPVIYNTQAKTICYTPIFHTIGHYSRFFNRGDHIIGSSSFSENVYCVASKDAKGSIKLVLANTSVQDLELHIRIAAKTATVPIQGESMLTLVIRDT